MVFPTGESDDSGTGTGEMLGWDEAVVLNSPEGSTDARPVCEGGGGTRRQRANAEYGRAVANRSKAKADLLKKNACWIISGGSGTGGGEVGDTFSSSKVTTVSSTGTLDQAHSKAQTKNLSRRRQACAR